MSIEKRMEGGGPKKMVDGKLMVEADPLHHIELELSGTLKQMFEEAKQEGFEGSFKSYIDSLSLEELKKVALRDGGVVDKK
jgi:hypothetical protein